MIVLAALSTQSTPAFRTAALYINTTRLPGCLGPRRVDDPSFDIARETEERFFDVDVALRTDLEKRDSELVCKCLSLFCAHGALLFPVTLVADKDLVDALGCVLFNVAEPSSDV